MELITPKVALGQPSLGQRPVWLVDDQGRLVHTEPLCVVSEKYHSWFFSWLEEQTLPKVEGRDD